AAEIRRTESLIKERVADPAVDVVALFGALEAEAQDRAIAPAPPGRRKVVLATSIAETSLTIEGVRVVIDCGLARVPRYEPDVGLTRLETVRVSQASADQRRGRAGRTEPGVCYRLWDEPETRALVAFERPEIVETDLSRLALDLARWGAGDAGDLAFLDPPPAAAMGEARVLLERPGRGAAAMDDGMLLAEAFPERIAKARGRPGEYQLASGRGVVLDPPEPLAREPWLAVAELGGGEARDRVLLAARIDEAA